MTTLQDPPATPGAPGTPIVRSESPFRHLARELVSFGVVGTIGTALTFIFSNLGGHFVSTNPMVTVVIPMTLSTVVSYLLSRAYTFRHRDSDGSSKEVLLFFAVNAIGMIIQLACWNVRTYALHLNGPISQNVTLAIGTVLGAAFRYWSYKKWIFLTPRAVSLAEEASSQVEPHMDSQGLTSENGASQLNSESFRRSADLV